MAERSTLRARRSPRSSSASPGRGLTSAKADVAKAGPNVTLPSAGQVRVFVALLAFLNGWGDVVTMQRFTLYSSKMSGNAIKMATWAAQGQLLNAGFLAAVLLCYVSGIVFYTLAHKRRRQRGFTASAVSPAVALGFVAVDLLPRESGWPALLLAFAWGILNALSSHAGDTITTMITGHLLTLGTALGATLTAEITPAQRDGARKSLTVFLTFVTGVLLAAAGILPSARPSPLGTTQLPCFSALGVCYALLMLMHDRPALWRSLLRG